MFRLIAIDINDLEGEKYGQKEIKEAFIHTH